ncbi:MAG: energy transducer TonB [Vicinamibacterales bacterium]
MDAVTQVLAGRGRDAGGLERMVAWSGLAHVALVATIALVPAGWLGHVDEEPTVVMTISVAGAAGPRSGGITPMSSRPVQELRPTEAKKAIEPVRPPAAREPEMIEPTKTAPKKQETKTKMEAKDPRGRTPTKGDEVRSGSAVAETGARGQGFGLSTGGGTGAVLDVGNFCCPEYIVTMRDLIDRNWVSKQQGTGVAVVKYTIQRDGTLTNIQLEKSTGAPALDLMAQRALVLTKQLPPLPAAFTESSLTVHLTFEYQR